MKAAEKWIREELCLPTDWREGHRDLFPFSLRWFQLSEMWPCVFDILVHGEGSQAGRAREGGQSTVTGTARSIAEGLIRDTRSFDGFEDEEATLVLADLLLCRCLGNAERDADRDAAIRRIVPTHPASGGLVPPGIRERTLDVPQLIAEMLANPDYRAGDLLGKEILLSAFAEGPGPDPGHDPTAGDGWRIDPGVGLDQLLTIRMALKAGNSPSMLSPDEQPRHPIATKAWDRFATDINLFVASYAREIPRHAFTGILESCLAVGLSALLADTVQALVHWKEHGRAPEHAEQKPFPLLANCSSETIPRLRLQAEASFDELMAKLRDAPTILMTINLLGRALSCLGLEDGQGYSPARRLELLGDVLHGRSPESRRVMRFLVEKTGMIESASARGDRAAIVMPRLEEGGNPAIRLAEGLVSLDSGVDKRLLLVATSAFGTDRPSGLAARRSAKVSRVDQRDVLRQQAVLTDTALDYLVHLFLAQAPDKPGGDGRTFRDFLGWLRDQHGIHVDRQPPGNAASSDLMRDNRLALEHRMCDLGVLESAHDAEEMKRVLGRFKPGRVQWN